MHRPLVLVVLGALAAVMAGLLVLRAPGGVQHLGGLDAHRRRSVPASRTAVVPVPGVAAPAAPVGVLHRWDAARAAAYASGSVSRLRRLYVPGSAAGMADDRLLRAYGDRGLRVTGMRMQLLAVTVLDRGPGRLRLRVTDRLYGATAVGHGRRLRLPRDQASVHVLELHRVGRHWRVASVTNASTAAAVADSPWLR